MPEFNDWLRPRVRTMQIISLALSAGAIFTTALMIFLRAGNAQPPAMPPLVTIVAAVVAANCFLFSFLIPAMLRGAQLKRFAAANASATPETLIDLCQSTLIVGLALLEGPVFFCAIAYLIEGQVWILAGNLIGISLMALRLPTELGVLAWLEAAGNRILELRETKP